MAWLERLVRYPLKGFGGQDLDRTALRAGAGLPYDRFLAVANGRSPVRPGGRWTRCEAFVRLTRNPELPLFHVDADDSALTLVSPGGEKLKVDLDDPEAADEVLASWFPSEETRLVRAEAGYWDHEDAHISLINLETADALSRAAGRPLDPLRFRGNLYVRGLPAWEEFGLLGRRLMVGGTELEILRLIDRCRATSIDPVNATVDVNVPALLGRRFGHVFCGVYARVVRGGPLGLGDPVVDLGENGATPFALARPATTPDFAEWPRASRIVSRVRESRDVVSLWLRDPLAGLREAPLPGQHLRIHGGDEDGPLWRSYTVSAVEGDLLRISVKRQGRMSALLHSVSETAPDSTPDPAPSSTPDPAPGFTSAPAPEFILMSGPFGDMVLPDTAPSGEAETHDHHQGRGLPEAEEGPLLLVSAGIGITPMVAILRACAERGTARQVTLLHVARDGRSLALWQEAVRLVRGLPNSTARLFLTRPGPGEIAAYAATEGRPGPDVLAASVSAPALESVSASLPDAGPVAGLGAGSGAGSVVGSGAGPGAGTVAGTVVYLCGPTAFMREAKAALVGAGADPDLIHYDLFASPDAVQPSAVQPSALRTPPAPGPFTVHFAVSDLSARWEPGSGSLLDLAEAQGLQPRASCRSGVCRTCLRTVSAGTAVYLSEPLAATSPGTILLCSAVPAGDLTIQC
ncbi:MOSC domain-containing protein [Streptosporangium carneum]|uniref:Sulfurase n=1 Tax=Streptosporangium carneum TaxID=47481 RepID=A0A9W6I8Y4_9ACTN|nr:MOSC domain-containing protein [Streptosporangium carneum]GLK13100.1 hypothetical protein GCM10017600_65110 [Streptosporangium carneum]